MDNLIIKNLGPLRDIDLNLNSYLILIGPQSSGKSLIAKIITTLKSIKFLAGTVTFEQYSRHFLFSNFLTNDTYIRYTTENYIFEYTNNAENLKFITVNIKEHIETFLDENSSKAPILGKEKVIEKVKPKLEELTVRANKLDENGSREELELIKHEIKEIQDLLSESEIFEKNFKESLIRIQSFCNYSQYIPAERNLVSIISSSILTLTEIKVPIPSMVIEFAANFERAKSTIKSFTIPFLDKYTFSYSDGKDLIHIKDENKSINISESSSGLQTLVPLLIVVNKEFEDSQKLNLSTTYVIEEPELNLFPETQYDLLKYLTDIITAEEFNNDFIITTHSPYILSGANNLLLSYKVKQNQELLFTSINPSKFNAYSVKEGKAYQIFDLSTGLISENMIDTVSEYIINDFEYLMNFLKPSI